LALKFGDPGVVGVGPAFFFGDQAIQVGMFGFQGIDMLRRGHALTSFDKSQDVYNKDANAVGRTL